MDRINLFVPGRLCLFGEHSDWAGMYRTVNSQVAIGEAIVTGVEQGIYAEVETSSMFEVTSDLTFFQNDSFSSVMDTETLLQVARKGGFFSYVAGVAAYINDNYVVGGLKIKITGMDLPVKSGLSSSAAICVLVARAFNRIYNLQMNVKGEMLAAFRGEHRTPSRCGRLDQACAYGVKPVFMTFDGDEVDSKELHIGATMHWVIANLMSSKDTIKILGDLNRCYPFAQTECDEKVQEALGIDNHNFIVRAKEYLEKGLPEELGNLMNEWQENFDRKVMPASSELKGPVLHSVLQNEKIRSLTYGGKGVGSQGDGSVQFLAKDYDSSIELQTYLKNELGMPSFMLTLHPGQIVKKAIIPLAGFGTRVFPATKSIKKCFLPVMDNNNILKPALLIMLEQLVEAGIEEICLVIGEDEQPDFERFFSKMPADVYDKLPEDKKKIQREILDIASRTTYVYQRERLGFGHAVWLCRQFTKNEPVLLMLGDFLYKSNNGINCCSQVINAFVETGKTTVSIQEVTLANVVHYGILAGSWINTEETNMNVDVMVEKPTDSYAEEYLGVSNRHGERKYYATFGQYILTHEVFDEMEQIINKGKKDNEEFQLTDALINVRQKSGMYGFLPDGRAYDIGLPESYYNTFLEYKKQKINPMC